MQRYLDIGATQPADDTPNRFHHLGFPRRPRLAVPEKGQIRRVRYLRYAAQGYDKGAADALGSALGHLSAQPPPLKISCQGRHLQAAGEPHS
jgi:hypothetical protein